MVQDLILKQLRTAGLCIVHHLDRRDVRDINDYFGRAPVFVDVHVPEYARKYGDGEVARGSERDKASECVCILSDHVTTAPCLFELALMLTDVAGAYLGQEPVLYSSNAFWTRPGQAPLRGDIQAFHKDADDIRFLAMFTYLTDVLTDEDGPHELRGPDGIVRPIYGQAGTVFLADTSHDHRGLKPRSHERGIAWFRWGVSPVPPANVWDKIEPIPAARLGDRYPSDPRMRESIRLLVSPP